MNANTNKVGHLLPWLAIAVIVIVADQITKHLIVEHFRHGQSQTITPFFNLVRAHNTGAAFSFLADESGWQRWFFIVLAFAAALFIIWMLVRHGGPRLFNLALSLILGGAIGNVADRLMHGYVVDFVQLHWKLTHYFPAFNVADSAITIGALMLVTDELRRMRRAG